MADPSAFELMLGGGLSDTAKQRMIANQLRNRQQVGDISMLSGDPKLGKFGSELNQDVGRSEASALAARGGEQQREVQKAYYDQLAKQNALANTMADRRESEAERHNREMEAIGLANSGKQADKDVQKLAANLQTAGVPALRDAVTNLDGIIKNSGGDLPGMGATGRVPQFMLTQQGMKVRQAYAQVRNMFLRTRSGQAVTDRESDRLMEELGDSPSDATLISAWPRIMSQVNAIERDIKAGFDDETVKTYEKNQQRGAGAPPAGAPAGAPAAVKWGDLGR